jgi:diguanylate cyclase (GGDEF)-like protein
MPTLGTQIAETAAAIGASDLMVFAITDGGARLIGGTGRGAGWAGVVDVRLADEPTARRVVESGRVGRVEEAEPVRVIGPYWSAHAALIRVGDHLVVVGADSRIRASSAELMTRATEAVAAAGEIPPSKLLADELELADAVRQLTDHTPGSLAEAAAHVAAVAADSLSCEIGAVLLQRAGRTEVHGAGMAWDAIANDDALRAALHGLAARAARGAPIVEQDLAAVGDSGLRIVSCYALGIGRSEAMGALIVGHTDARPRGFTQLCQRVGRALADAAEPALRLAIAQEDLAAQRDRFAVEARTDPLTELGNRVTWEETLSVEQARRERHPRPLVLLALDLDGLKETNDTHGHAAGDELLVAAAGVLREALRAGDIIARIGGDEFAAILPDADPAAAEAIRAKIATACARWRGRVPGLRLNLSMGWAAPEPLEKLSAAFGRADAAMYEAKRGAA